MTDKPITAMDLSDLAMAALTVKPGIFKQLRDRVAIEKGNPGWPGYRQMTDAEVKARDEANIQREVRNKALVDQALCKLSQEEIDALEWYYSSVFY